MWAQHRPPSLSLQIYAPHASHHPAAPDTRRLFPAHSLEPDRLDSNHAPPLPSCVTLGRRLNLSVLSRSHFISDDRALVTGFSGQASWLACSLHEGRAVCEASRWLPVPAMCLLPGRQPEPLRFSARICRMNELLGLCVFSYSLGIVLLPASRTGGEDEQRKWTLDFLTDTTALREVTLLTRKERERQSP